MKIKRLSAAVLLVITFACDNDDYNVVSEKTSLLTLTVDASYLTSDSDDWIIIHGEDGSLLASEIFETNQQMEIVTDKPVPGKIMITHLQLTTAKDGHKYYLAKSHSNIEKGKEMIFRNFNPPALTGKLNVSVSNVVYYDYFSLSNRVNSSGSASWSSATNIWNFNHTPSTTFPSISSPSLMDYR